MGRYEDWRAECVAGFGQWVSPMLKHQADLDRYARIIAECRPEVIVETGTRTGDSARWFASQSGVDLVVTVDVTGERWWYPRAPVAAEVLALRGSSIDPNVLYEVYELVHGRPCLVSLDSDHSRPHVVEEIRQYMGLVTAGSYLVVEDGVLAWLDDATTRAHGCEIYDGNPLQAITECMPELESAGYTDVPVAGVTMYPHGWLARHGSGRTLP